jgi:hypothetical protein
LIPTSRAMFRYRSFAVAMSITNRRRLADG